MIAINEIVAASHFFIARSVRPGDTVVDATAGNGGDTVFLAGLVGPAGRVHAFDIQKTALDRAGKRLKEEGLEERVRLHLASHARMAEYIDRPVQGIMFNLGYLPGGDKEVITRPRETLGALASGLSLLGPGGLISITTYPGHPGGEEEEQGVAGWCAGLEPRRYTVFHLQVLNRLKPPPGLWLIRGENI